jgi:hypothetical protein
LLELERHPLALARPKMKLGIKVEDETLAKRDFHKVTTYKDEQLATEVEQLSQYVFSCRVRNQEKPHNMFRHPSFFRKNQ